MSAHQTWEYSGHGCAQGLNKNQAPGADLYQIGWMRPKHCAKHDILREVGGCGSRELILWWDSDGTLHGHGVLNLRFQWLPIGLFARLFSQTNHHIWSLACRFNGDPA